MFESPPPTDAASNKLQSSNMFTIAKRTVDAQDMLYQSMKLSNGIWVLAELRLQAGSPNYTVCGRNGPAEGIVLNELEPRGCHLRWILVRSIGMVTVRRQRTHFILRILGLV